MTALAAPDRSLAQRMEALQHANDTRSRRRVLKRQIKAGDVSVIEVVCDPPAFMLTIQLFDLLLAVPRFGRVKVGMVLSQCRLSPSKPLGELTVRQQVELCAAVQRRGLR